MNADEPQIIQHNLRLMPKQAQFVFDDEHWEILYSGAYGAGKSRALCCRAVRLAQYPGARVGLVRKALATLRSSTMITLLEPDGELPAVLPPNSYVFHRAENWIQVNGGGTIVFFGCDEETKVGSRPLTDICIDEAVELDEAEYMMLLGRRRGQYLKPDGTPNTRSISMATNPGPPSHFLYKRFFLDRHDKRLVIETNASENYHLTSDYTESLNEMPGAFRERYYMGRWVAFEGSIYWMFDPTIHVKHDPGPFERYVAGVDWGFKNPSAIRVHGINGHSRKSHVVAEHYRNMVVSNEFTDICKATSEAYKPIVFVVDPSAADLKAQMRQAGLTVFDGNNDVLAGIRRMESDLTPGPNGPMLTMELMPKKHHRDVTGNDEYPAYRWNDATIKEQPVKEFDHALDADRYARMYIHSRSGSGKMILLNARGAEKQEKPAEPEDRDVEDDRWFESGSDGGDRRIRKMGMARAR